METFIVFTAKYLYIAIVIFALIFFFTLTKENRKRAIYLIIISGMFAWLLTLFGGRFINDPRPFVVDHVKPLISHTVDNGFPSDHTLVAMLASFLVFIFNKKVGLVLMILSIFVGVSRVLAKVHHPLDVVGSICIALISVSAALFILLKISELSGRKKSSL
jgi:undecaprenyl-diphosphatase